MTSSTKIEKKRIHKRINKSKLMDSKHGRGGTFESEKGYLDL